MAVSVTGRPARMTAWLPVFDGQIGRREHFRARDAGAAREGAEAGQQFLEVEGLGEVIVGAAIEAGHAVVHGAAGGQHEDGRAKSGGAQFAADRVTILDGKHHVENHEVVFIDLRAW